MDKRIDNDKLVKEIRFGLVFLLLSTIKNKPYECF